MKLASILIAGAATAQSAPPAAQPAQPPPAAAAQPQRDYVLSAAERTALAPLLAARSYLLTLDGVTGRISTGSGNVLERVPLAATFRKGVAVADRRMVGERFAPVVFGEGVPLAARGREQRVAAAERPFVEHPIDPARRAAGTTEQ